VRALGLTQMHLTLGDEVSDEPCLFLGVDQIGNSGTTKLEIDKAGDKVVVGYAEAAFDCRDRVERFRRPVVADAGGGFDQRNGWLVHKSLSSKERGKGGKIDGKMRSCFRHPRRCSRPQAKHSHTELVFRRADRS